MFKKVMIATIFSGLGVMACYAKDVAPKTLLGHRMIMSYYHATGQLKKKVGDTYYSDLGDHVFFSAMLDGEKPHKGFYDYHRTGKDEGEITVEHPKGLYKGWTYSMHLHFDTPHLGTFSIADKGRVTGTMRGVFELS